MQPILSTDNTEPITQSNGYVKQSDDMDGVKTIISNDNRGEDNNEKQKEKNSEKVVLPVEMACMVPLRALIGKLVHKSHADLITMTDT